MVPANRSGAAARRGRDGASVLLTPRDVDALRWIGEQFAIRVDQLPRLLAQDGREVSRRTCRGVLERWTGADFVVRRKVFANEPGWVWLTRHGSNAAAVPYKLWVPKFGNLSHVYWVNQVRLQTALKHPDVLWVCERSIRKEQPRNVHFPDAELATADGARVAVEVELTQKSAARASAIVRELAARYRTVWFFLEGRTQRAIERATNGLSEQDRRKFKLYPLELVR